MKIAIINVNIGRGSVGRIVSDLYEGLKKTGNSVKLIYAREIIGNYADEDLIKIGSKKDIYMHACKTRIFGNTASYSKKPTVRLVEELDSYNPDIVHIHGVYGYYLNMKILFDFLSSKRVNVISTLHSCWDFTGHCCYFDYIKCNQWQDGCKNCKQIHSYPYSLIDNTSRNYITKKELYLSLSKCTIVVPSTWMESYVKKSFLNAFPCRVIRNGIDQNVFKPKSISQGNNTVPKILCVANNWEPRKGWNDVVELSYYEKNNVELIVVGANKKQASELSKNTVVIERTDSTDALANLYQDATVLFNPTYEDNYPTVNLEAASCGTPVVTYNTGGSPELFQLGKFGWTIEKKDYATLLNIVERVFNKNETFPYERIKLLSNKHMVQEYLELYKSI